MQDVIIVGAGPAGATAAMYTAQANLKTLILYKDFGALKKAPRVDNFYGNFNITGKELIENGISQAKHFGAKVTRAEAVGIQQNDDLTFTIKTTRTTYAARKILIATGTNRQSPKIKGLAPLEGRGVSYCAICDGFFHRGKDVAVIGNSSYALHEARDLLSIAKSVTILTNGKNPTIKFPDTFTVRQEKILEICSQKGMLGPILQGVALEGNETIAISGLFIALGVAGGTELARKLGATIQNNAIYVDDKMRTTIPNLWAAGDCAGGLKQIVKAAHEGATAGMDIVSSFTQA